MKSFSLRDILREAFAEIDRRKRLKRMVLAELHRRRRRRTQRAAHRRSDR